MENTQSPVSDRKQDDRDLLASRVIPTMTMSTATNLLTKPLPPNLLADPDTRANSRFAVEGNAIVTGGAGALGLVVARALLEHGASTVSLFDLPATLQGSSKAIVELNSEFVKQGRRVFTFPVDVTDARMVHEAVQQAVSAMNGVDILCCMAGIVDCSHSISADPAKFSKVIDVNLTGSFICAQAVASQMIQQGRGGSIVFTGSISAHHTNFPQPQAAYNVSKAAVIHLTRNLAVEWSAHGIRVNCISPGYMDTILNAGENLRAIRDIWASNCPMGRMGDVEEITGPMVMLCSRRAGRYITGADILVDGGAMCL